MLVSRSRAREMLVGNKENKQRVILTHWQAETTKERSADSEGDK